MASNVLTVITVLKKIEMFQLLLLYIILFYITIIRGCDCKNLTNKNICFFFPLSKSFKVKHVHRCAVVGNPEGGAGGGSLGFWLNS